MVSLVVIPGAQLTPVQRRGTAAFLEQLAVPYRCLEPTEAPYDPRCVRRLLQQVPTSEVVVIAFSAGVVGAVGALQPGWLKQSGLQVEALIALDGWLVPLFVPFPCYRLSHDYFTHQTCRPLGMGALNFWAEPQVSHLDLWEYPARAQGWELDRRTGVKTPSTAQAFLQERLQAHQLKPS